MILKSIFYQFSRNAILAEQVTSCKIKKTALLNVQFLCDNTFLYSSLSDDSDHKLLAIKSAQYVSLTVLLLLLLWVINGNISNLFWLRIITISNNDKHEKLLKQQENNVKKMYYSNMKLQFSMLFVWTARVHNMCHIVLVSQKKNETRSKILEVGS